MGQDAGVVTEFISERVDNIYIQMFKYTLVGGLAFVVDFMLLYLLTEFAGLYYLASAMLSFMVGLAINYCLCIAWVFHYRKVKRQWVEFGVFLAVGLWGIGLNILFIWFFTEIMGNQYLVSKLGATFFVYLWNFCARKIALF